MSPADLEPLALIAAEVAAEWGLELGPPFALSAIPTSRRRATTRC